MAVPNSRATLKTYCKRRLGSGMVDINITSDQEDDVIDDALQFYQDYHYDAIVRSFLKHQVTSSDKTNKYISIGTSVTGVINVYPISSDSTVNMFDLKYQMRLNDLHDFSDVQMMHYSMVSQNLEMIDQMLVGKHPFDFSRHQDRLHIHMDWTNDVSVDEYLLIEAYEILSPETYTSVYNDRFLKQYATALMKRQWGQNLIKFQGVKLPGGVELNGRQIYDDGQRELDIIREQMSNTYELPPLDFIG